MNLANADWPWRVIEDATGVTIIHPVRVCGRGNEPHTAVVAYRTAAGDEVSFVVPVAAIGDPQRAFGRGIMADHTVYLRGDRCNEIRDAIRSGWRVPDPPAFVPRVPTAVELSADASRYGDRRRQFQRAGMVSDGGLK